MSRLLTTAQAAHVLAVSVKTMKKWREAGSGPAYVQLHESHPDAWRGNTVRYHLPDLLAFQQRIDERVAHVRGTGELPAEPAVSDHQWAIVEAALRWEFKMGRLGGVLDLGQARAQFLGMLQLAVIGTLHEADGVIRRGGANENALARWLDHGWLEVAFRALADDPTFEFTMIKQVLVMPHRPQESRVKPGLFAAARMKSEMIGRPPTARKRVEKQTPPAAVSPAVVATAAQRARISAWRAAARRREQRRELLYAAGVTPAPSGPDGSVQVNEP